MNNRDIMGQLVIGTWDGTNSTNFTDTIANYNSAMEVIYGRVQNGGYISRERFVIDDGSGKLIPVWAPGASVYQRDYVRVKGSMSLPFQYHGDNSSVHWFPPTFYSYGGVQIINSP
jgi:hypothetical protein